MTLDVDLNLTSNTDELKETSFLYRKWLKIKKQQGGYFLLANNIEEYLPLLKSSAAINLYLYYAIHAKNEEGYSWPSVSTLAQALGTSERTINNWNGMLQDAGLILRVSSNKNSYVTQLLPTEDFILNVDHFNKHKVVSYLNDAGFNATTTIFFNFKYKTEVKQSSYRVYVKECRDKKGKKSFDRCIILEESIKGNPALFKRSLKKSTLFWGDNNLSGDKLTFIVNLAQANEKNYKDLLKLITQLQSKWLITKFKQSYKEDKLEI